MWLQVGVQKHLCAFARLLYMLLIVYYLLYIMLCALLQFYGYLFGLCPSLQLLQLLCFWTLSIILFLFGTQRFGDWILSPSSGKNISSWAQSIELVPISGRFLPEDGDRLQSPKHCVLNEKQDGR
jgi:hypothetical protein